MQMSVIAFLRYIRNLSTCVCARNVINLAASTLTSEPTILNFKVLEKCHFQDCNYYFNIKDHIYLYD